MMFAARRCFFNFFLIAAVVVALSILQRSGEAQSLPSDPNVDNGTHWYGSYDGVHDNVSLSSGNVSFCIPLVSLPGRANHKLSIPLCYNSQFQEMYMAGGQPQGVADVLAYFPWVWAPNTPSGDKTPPMGPGWVLSGAPAYYASPTTSASGTPTEFMPDGAKYAFPSSGGIGPDGQNADLYQDSQTVFMKDGTRFVYSTGSNCPVGGCSAEEFTDGNVISFTNTSVTDTVGRTVAVSSGSTFSGSNKTASSAYVEVQYPDSSGTTRTVTVEMSTMQFSCSNTPSTVVSGEVGSGAPYGGPYSMPTAIILPDGLTYTFQYDSCGMLRKVTYPSGGYTRYDYAAQEDGMTYQAYTQSGSGYAASTTYYVNQISAKHVCPTPALSLGATSTASGDNCSVAEETTTYTPTVHVESLSDLIGASGNSNTQNVVVDPVLNKTVYQFSLASLMSYSGIPAVETSRQMYDASGKLWKTVTTQYASTTVSAPSGVPWPALPTIQTTTLDNSMVSQIQWTYDLRLPSLDDSPLVQKSEYDFGQGTKGLLLRTTKYDWLHLDNPSVYGWPTPSGGAHICDRKTSEIVYDGSGKTLEQTTYVYDNNTPATSGAKGLLTSVTNWRSTGGASLTTNYVHDSYGNVTSKTDPNNNLTQYSYADNYADGDNRSSYAFLTKTTYPAANGVTHVTQAQYYWGSGLVAAMCGENFTGTCAAGLTSGADYATYTYDLMGRKTSTTTGDGGHSTNSFSEMSSEPYPLQVGTTEIISSGVTKISAAVLDGEARTVQSQLLSDPSCVGGTVNVDTTYDLDGRVSTVSNPYCSTNAGASTSGLTTKTYDGLSRVIQITHPDNSSATNTYIGRATLSSDEGNGTSRVQRISQMDALGRLISVCEVTGATQLGTSNTPAACGLDVSGTGFLTTYGYDASGSNGPLESFTSVSQGGVNRGFIYDSLGELKSATNPESGTTTYIYDNDSNLTGKTDALGKTTTYNYDSLNRVTGKSYSDGTASACFQYDQNSSGRGIGRMATEWTQAGTCSSAPPASGALTKRTLSAYDLLGRLATDQQCATPGNCGGNYTLNYTYDLAGDISTFANGLSNMSFTNQYNAAGRLSTVTDSQANIPLFTAATTAGYTPAGALMNATIGSGISFHRDYNNRLLPVDEIDTVATTPGTATVQITGAEQLSAYSTGSFTFSGTEQSTTSGGTTIYDSGIFSITLGGTEAVSLAYSQSVNSTPQALASSVANELTCTGNGLVSAVANGPTVYLTSCVGGINTEYSLSASLSSHSSSFAQPSFAISGSGAAMTPVINAATTGGINALATSVTFSGVEAAIGPPNAEEWNTGLFVVFIWSGAVGSGPPAKTVEVSWGQGSTPESLAESLAASFSPCATTGTVVTAYLSGPTVSISGCQTGTTYSISTDVNESNFTPVSFTAATNGSTPVTTVIPAGVYDSGRVTLILNGTEIASSLYGSSSTPTSIASTLASAAASNGLVTLQVNGSNLVMTAIDDGTQSDYSYALNIVSNSVIFTDPSFAPSSPSGSLIGGGSSPLYNWSISSYAPNGDVLAMTDAVMGSWTYAYDGMNRLTSGTASAGVDAGLTLGWTYDRYGNRWAQNATGTGNASAVQPQLSFTGNNHHVDGWSYDVAGNLLYDEINHYTYDAENRIASLNGAPAYIYDAEGRRVAKTNSAGAVTASYVLGLGGEQVSELNGAGVWAHSNVFAGGRLLATYEGSGGAAKAGYHFHLTDWLGTQRMQTTAAGNQEEVCYSYPFGDGLSCTGTDATEHHFTGKERDTESGLDYFGARYHSSNLGRFMTPDWAGKPTAVPYASFGNPQSLNLYAYVGNNPSTGIDLDGHDWGQAWQHFAAALTQISGKVTLGLGAEIKSTIGGKGSPYTLSGGVAIKDNIKFSNGTESSSISGNGGVSAGQEGGTRIGLEGSLEKQYASVNVITGESSTGGPGTSEGTVGVSHGDTTASVNSDGGFSIGGEGGEGFVGGGSLSITKEGISELKGAAGEAWSSIKDMFGGGSGQDGSSSAPSPSSTTQTPSQMNPQNPDSGGQAPH